VKKEKVMKVLMVITSHDQLGKRRRRDHARIPERRPSAA
jgi:hypothetical protein